MRLCPRCQIELSKGNYLVDQGKYLSDFVLIKKNEDYSKTKYLINAALCPQCGYIELYVDMNERGCNEMKDF